MNTLYNNYKDFPLLQVGRTFLYNLKLDKISATNGKKQLWDKKKVQKIENKRVKSKAA